MKEIPPPSAFIDSSISNLIRASSAAAEKLGTLHPEQLSAIYEQRWFNLFVPKAHNGLELSFTEGLQIEEGLAWADGSVGWTVTLCAGANWFIGFLQPELVKEIFNDDKVCLAGSGHPGCAKIVEDGYQITGYWKYATGAPHATAFTANCILEENGVALQTEDGSPLIRSFLFLRSEVMIHEDWNSMGMVATASHSFEVRDLFVPKERSFIIDPHCVFLNQPLYQLPFLQFAEATLAVNSSGMAWRFHGLCEIIFEKKKENDLNERWNKSKNDLEKARQSFYSYVQLVWEECMMMRSTSPQLLSKLSEASRKLATTSRSLVDELYPYCGMMAAQPGTEINRVWRNLHTASQHGLLQ